MRDSDDLRSANCNGTSANQNECAPGPRSTDEMLSCAHCCDPSIDFAQWLSASPPKEQYRLLQSHYITRHGDRTQVYHARCWDEPATVWDCTGTLESVSMEEEPFYRFTIAPINGTETLPGNCMLGMLTPKGHRQLIGHGRGARHRYVEYYGIIPDALDHDTLAAVLGQVRLRADSFPRVQQSVMAFFVGLYPNADRLSRSVSIPIYVEDQKYEILTFSPSKPTSFVCPQMAEIAAAMKKTDRWLYFKNQIEPVLDRQSAELLRNADAQYYDAFDCGVVHLCHAKPAPARYTQEMFDEVQLATLYDTQHRANYPDYYNASKFQIGPLLGLIHQRFRRMVQKEEGGDSASGDTISPLYVYGGHDIAPIIPLLSAFQFHLNEWVPYAATITLELFANRRREYFVQLSYNGEILSIPQCDGDDENFKLCAWDRFERWIRKIVPTKEECPNMKIDHYLRENV